MVCFRYIIVNTLYKGDDKDDDIITIVVVEVVVVVIIIDIAIPVARSL
jgi:hypothetical protein